MATLSSAGTPLSSEGNRPFRAETISSSGSLSNREPNPSSSALSFGQRAGMPSTGVNACMISLSIFKGYMGRSFKFVTWGEIEQHANI
ncbi:hypothetical protein SERLA73DRAFT_188729 [Serpula lacrymans var. lacrymans S7.3]|uniref:Uncharacterized protein n=1 Tax=Serpula lacrymans var. lacrymans (strain S7.3) TaxID=936435 RepID=F8QC21_SERL3|nr:hypothetical protein SERLA73DRAFT_188729 [Serpula lacrymans var. lacrymans S7.3]